jgi:peptidoglycan/xylan/chitin deacetylase (PgdA/CDA1 family)
MQTPAPREIFILNLHGIGTPRKELPASEHNVWISEAQFEMLLDQIKDRGDVELTFDDANESDYTIALPALQRRAMKAQFFLVAGRIGEPGYLSRSRVSALVSAGMKIGGHGFRHRRWTGLDSRDLREELVEAKDRLEQLTGTAIDRAACPFGSYNRRIIRNLRDAGYRCVYTSDGGRARTDALIQSRNSVSRSDTPETIRALCSERFGGLGGLWHEIKLTIKRWT